MKVSLLLQLLPSVICFIAASAIYLQNLGGVAAISWRRYVAAGIPAVYTFVLLLVWLLPVQIFLSRTLEAGARVPLVVLTFLCVVIGACLPASYFRLRRAEADGRVYAALGVRRFRNIVAYGAPMVRLMRRIDPASYTRLNKSTLAERERRTRKTEKIHWAMLLGTIPAAVCAVLLREYWFGAYLVAANVPMNVYPIMLQRYTRARLERIRRSASCQLVESLSHSRMRNVS
jgi:hypothetical protein